MLLVLCRSTQKISDHDKARSFLMYTEHIMLRLLSDGLQNKPVYNRYTPVGLELAECKDVSGGAKEVEDGESRWKIWFRDFFR